ncbi:head decoration protein [Sulfurovum sp.]|uniref:head decoration protein n=1 Tax=Sulfurovum sp. TaxID=1969726 RepID=UPI00262D4C66|nr:head decoration protein [Sulfurovum sp.]
MVNSNTDNLVAGTTQLVTDSVTIASGAALTRGAVLGKVTADGKYKLSASAASDGSETAYAVLAEDVDASSTDVAGAAVYIKGEFNENALNFGAGHTADSVKPQLRTVGIFVKTAVKA